jgi:palmitoyltransferase ZDHHC6
MGYRLLHWGPLIALSVIAAISLSTVVCHLQWWPLKTPGALANAFVFALWNALTLYNFFRAAFVGPGYVPLGWKPVST